MGFIDTEVNAMIESNRRGCKRLISSGDIDRSGVGLSLAIIVHELGLYGTIHVSEGGSESFEDSRLFLESSKFSFHPNLLYICTSEHQPSDTEMMEQCCCLVVHPGSTIPDSYFLVLESEHDGLFVWSAIQDLFLEFRLWENAIDRSTANREGVQALLDSAQGLVPNHVVVIDSSMHLVAHTKYIGIDNSIISSLIDRGYFTDAMIQDFKLHISVERWTRHDGFVVNGPSEISKYDQVIYSFRTKDAFSLVVIMSCNEVPCAQDVIDRFEKLVERIGVYARNDYVETTPAGITANTRFRMLIDGIMTEEAEIRNFAEMAGIPFEGSFCLFAIRADESESPIASYVSQISKISMPAKTFYAEPYIVVLCSNCSRVKCARICNINTCDMACESHTPLAVRINEALIAIGAYAGRSARFFSLAGCRTAFVQACTALSVGKRIDDSTILTAHPELDFSLVRPTEGIDAHIKPYEMFIRASVFSHLSTADNASVYNTYAIRTIDRIAADDAALNTDNYRFLYYYIMYERRASIVADKLFMHRNNVRYRIDRIEATYHINTEDADTRFAFLEAYHMRNVIHRLQDTSEEN